MTISILTLFPEIFTPYISASIIGRARNKNQIQINLINIRDFAKDKHKSVDDKPYGGGIGMILMIPILVSAIEYAQKEFKRHTNNPYNEKVILLDPVGTMYTQKRARYFAKKIDHLILICGHYEGIDYRIHHYIDESISIGRYVLTGGEIPALVILDTITRLIPNVLAKSLATVNESYSPKSKFEAPQYTRPPTYQAIPVPKELLSGNHKLIQEWRAQQIKLLKTKRKIT